MISNIEPKVIEILLKEAHEFVKQLMLTKLPGSMRFHNFKLMKRELDVLALLLAETKLPETTNQDLNFAITFRLSGYTQSYNNWLEMSQKIAQSFLDQHNYPAENIAHVIRLIGLSAPQFTPANPAEEIVKDVITARYGQKKYRRGELRQREEFNLNNERSINLNNWLEIQKSQLEKHNYYSPLAQQLFDKRKAKNISKLEKYVEEIHKRKKNNSFSTDSAARMMFKTALRNHVDLTAVGDQKANIMLSINAIILTVGIPLFAKYSSNMLYLTIPATIFMITCVTTMVYAALATRPVKMNGEIDMAKLNDGKTDLFFFGNFYGIRQDTYHSLIRTILDDRKLLDDSIINHLYFMGDGLGQKFVYLRRCYSIFIGGFVLTVVAFIITFLMVG
ncbi:MAG: Pycsar system effector family protein [Bacteroidota bacterium]